EDAVRSRADLVVMTTHGRGPMARFWLGSVVDHLVRELPMPLLLVRPTDGPIDMKQERPVRHILVPLDGSPLSEQALEPAISLGGLTEASYTLLRVTPVVLSNDYPGFGSSEEWCNRVQERLTVQAQDYLDLVAGRMRKRGLKATTVALAASSPARVILHEATL